MWCRRTGAETTEPICSVLERASRATAAPQTLRPSAAQHAAAAITRLLRPTTRLLISFHLPVGVIRSVGLGLHCVCRIVCKRGKRVWKAQGWLHFGNRAIRNAGWKDTHHRLAEARRNLLKACHSCTTDTPRANKQTCGCQHPHALAAWRQRAWPPKPRSVAPGRPNIHQMLLCPPWDHSALSISRVLHCGEPSHCQGKLKLQAR